MWSTDFLIKSYIAETFILSSGSSFIKNEINCNLNGKYSSAFINGIFSLNEKRHHEIRTSINHLIENTKSYQLIKSVLENESKSVFNLFGYELTAPKGMKNPGRIFIILVLANFLLLFLVGKALF